MGGAEQIPRLTFDDFIARERSSTARHEWVEGIAYMMAGGTFEHGRLVDNALVLLRNKLEGKPCQVYSGNFLVRTPSELGAYPDLMVFCGPIQGDPSDPERVATNPTLLIEVLSPSTEAYDRGEKFEHYKTLPSLATYVLVSTGQQRVEVFQRSDGWRQQVDADDFIDGDADVAIELYRHTRCLADKAVGGIAHVAGGFNQGPAVVRQAQALCCALEQAKAGTGLQRLDFPAQCRL